MQVGCKIEYGKDGSIKNQKPIARAVGTTVSVSGQ